MIKLVKLAIYVLEQTLTNTYCVRSLCPYHTNQTMQGAQDCCTLCQMAYFHAFGNDTIALTDPVLGAYGLMSEKKRTLPCNICCRQACKEYSIKFLYGNSIQS